MSAKARRTGRGLKGVALAGLVALLLAGAASAPPAAQQAGKRLPPPPTDLPGHIEYLAAQLYGVPLDEAGPIAGEIEKLVLDHMSQWLAAHPLESDDSGRGPAVSYDVRVRHEMENVFGKLRGPDEANAAAFVAPLQGRRLIGLGYNLEWTEFNAVSVVALFEEGDEGARQVAATRLAPATSLHFRSIVPPAPAAGQAWFLVYGTRQGKSHPRLSVELFAYDGQALRTLWKRLDVYDGKISFPGQRIVIDYLNEDEFKQALSAGGAVVRHEAAYHPGPKGLEVEYDH